MTRCTDRRIRDLRFGPIHRDREMTRVTGPVKCQLIGQRGHCGAARILEYRKGRQQLRLFTGLRMAISASGNSRRLGVRVKEFHGQRGRAAGRPIGF